MASIDRRAFKIWDNEINNFLLWGDIGDIVNIPLDLTTGKIKFYKNGKKMNIYKRVEKNISKIGEKTYRVRVGKLNKCVATREQARSLKRAWLNS